RRPAARANGGSIEWHRRATAHAANRRDDRAQARQFGWFERTNEALFTQKLHIRREPSVTVAAAIIGEARCVLDVLRQRKGRRASRAREQWRIGRAARRPRRGDRAEQRNQRARRDLLAFGRIEPQRLAI